MSQKYIVNNNNLIMAHVEFHEEILGHNNNAETKGGGYWFYCSKREVWFFYNKSFDFGEIKFEQFKEAILNGDDEEFIGLPKCFSNIEYVSEAFKKFDKDGAIDFKFDTEINCHYV